MLRFLNSTPARVVTVLLIAQAALLYSSIRPEAVPAARPLAEFPRTIGTWNMSREGVIEQEVLDILKADDLLTRIYVDSKTQRGADLYIAAFRSQRNGKAPHSPKNCLPGNGWLRLDSGEIQIDVGAAEPIPVNRQVISQGDSRSVVLYWYQSRDRAVADEFKAKFWVIADAIRYDRTDTAIIRVIVPVTDRDSGAAEQTAVSFVKTVYGTIRQFLPS
jgi:EpsI family protein